MKVQILSFPECPNGDAAREALRRALTSVGLPLSFEDIDVTAAATPDELRRWGSPTILVDGADVAGESPTGPCCRLYAEDGNRAAPSEDLIRKALDRSVRGSWIRSLAVLPGGFVALLPAATCPVCLGAYSGLLSALGLGLLASERVLAPLVAGFLMTGLVSIAWSTRKSRTPGPFRHWRIWIGGRRSRSPRGARPAIALWRRNVSRGSVPLESVAEAAPASAAHSAPPQAE